MTTDAVKFFWIAVVRFATIDSLDDNKRLRNREISQYKEHFLFISDREGFVLGRETVGYRQEAGKRFHQTDGTDAVLSAVEARSSWS